MENINPEEKWELANTEEPEDHEVDVITYQINYYPADFTLKGYLDKWNSGQLYVPEFQRDFVWDQVRASKLIESFLLGLPVPGVFLYKEKQTNKFQVVDGQQRIRSAISFFKGVFNDKKFILKKVQKKWEGKSYEDLDDNERYQIDDAVLRATVVQQIDPDDDSSIFHLFERLNTGGVNLNPMEVRKCVYHGDFMNTLMAMNEDLFWRKIIGKTALDKRYRDVELILRVLAFTDNLRIYEKPMKEFLNKKMISVNKMLTEERLTYLEFINSKFNEVCKYIVDELGEKPFHLRGRLNFAAMDSVFGVIFHNDRVIEDLSERFNSLLKDNDFIDSVSVSTSDEKQVIQRFKKANEYLIG